MKKKKWADREYRRNMLIIFFVCFTLPSVKAAFDVMLPELPGIHRWILTVLVLVVIELNLMHICSTQWKRNDEKARQRAMEKEGQEN